MKPGVEGGSSKLKYKCHCCMVTPRGCDLKRHYKNCVDWSLFDKLKGKVGDRALVELRSKADPHTLYIFDRGYSRGNLPSYQTHVMVKQDVDEVRDRDRDQVDEVTGEGAGKQKTINHFFQVIIFTLSIILNKNINPW